MKNECFVRIRLLELFLFGDVNKQTNMLMTLKYGYDAIANKNDTLYKIVTSFATGTVFGARGNSGVIVSQFFKGVAEVLKDFDEVDCETFAIALSKGCESAYASVAKPVEGTILTVLKDAKNAVLKSMPLNNFDDLFDIYIKEAKASLERTPEFLPILKKAGVVDSVAALVPKAEIDGDMGDSHMGLQARLMSQALRKLAGAINKSKTVLIFINQLREKIGVMFGNPETTTGGRALKFYASVRMDIRKVENIKQDGEVMGNRVRVKVIKNKVAPPFREAEFDVMYGQGISKDGNVFDMAVNLDIVQKSGSWFSYNGERIGQGRENAKRYLVDSKLIKEVEKKVRENFAKAFEQSLGEEVIDEENDIEPEE